MTAGVVMHWLRKLQRDTQGVSIIEFALMLPILVMVGAGGLELINYVLANQKIERIASITADNVARNTLAPSEASFVDTFAGIEEIAAPFDFNADGRVIMTGVIGVPQSGSIVGKVVWQRCSGQLAGIASTIGKEAADPQKWAEGNDATLPSNIKLLQNQLVVVSEVAYRYEPLVSLAQLPSSNSGAPVRQRSIFVSRGQAFPYVTPSSGVTAADCD
jgi:Flp pilus assembly protein TadG